MHKLGMLARDIVTGFTGTITARVEYLGAQPRYRVEACDHNGKPIEEWFDEGRLSTNDAAPE